MAYDFDGATQDLSVASVPATVEPLTLFARMNLDSVTGNRGIFGEYRTSVLRAEFYLSTLGNVVAAISADAAGFAVAQTTATIGTGAWHDVCGVFASITSRTIYLNGGNAVNNATSKVVAGLDTTFIGTFIASDFSKGSRVDGRIADCAIWNVELTAAEVASLSKGYSPLMVRPAGLRFYAPLVRVLHDVKGGLILTNTGSTPVAAHHRIIMPRRRQMNWTSAAAAAAGPTLAMTVLGQVVGPGNPKGY